MPITHNRRDEKDRLPDPYNPVNPGNPVNPVKKGSPHQRDEGNRLRLPENPGGFYEVYYLMFREVEQQLFGWFRFMVLVTSDGRKEAAVWGSVIDMADSTRSLAIKQIFPLAMLKSVESPFHISIGESFLSACASSGRVCAGENEISWNLTIGEEGIDIGHIPALLRNKPLPPTKFVAPYCGCKVSGTVNFRGALLRFENTPGIEAHFWGPKNVVRYLWGHCANFQEDPDFIFDGVTATARQNGLTLPPMTVLFFRWQGQTYECNGMIASFLRNRSDGSLTGWRFEAASGDFVFRGEFRSDPERALIWVHTDPDGEEKFAHLNIAADLKIEILRKRGGKLEHITTVTADRSATFECALPARDPRVKTVYPHITHPRQDAAPLPTASSQKAKQP